MIKIEIITHNGKEFRKTSTDSELTMLRKKGTNETYTSAIDLRSSTNEYEEIPVPAAELERRRKMREMRERMSKKTEK